MKTFRAKTKHLWRTATAPGLSRAVAVFLLVVTVAVLGGAGYVSTTQATTIMPGVRVAEVDLGGLSQEAAADRLREAAKGLTLTYTDDGQKMTISPIGNVASYDIDAAVAQALRVGQHPNPFVSLFQHVQARAFSIEVTMPYRLDADRLTAQITERFGLLVKPAQDAKLSIAVNKNGAATVSVLPDADGTELNRTQLVSAAETALRTLTPTVTPVTVTKDEPELRVADVEPLRDGVAPLLARLPIRITAGTDNWTIDAQTAAQWITAKRGKDGVELGIDAEVLIAYLQPRADLLALKPVDAIFVEKDGRVTEFVPSQDGTMLDMDASVGRISDAIMVGGGESENGAVDLPIITDVAEIQTGASNRYGITELLGTGSSNFKGSPRNRRTNIDVGRHSLNGILVHPGEEFSLLKALGPIDGEHGYLEELVIKGNETKPEYGGGLCQIGTTTFRAVLASGLPVMERRNHSYRVSYYELDGDGNYMGPGKDATIYEPAPDFKFRNDMATSVMLRTRLIGTDKLVFEFWGKKDGRVAEQTNAVILTSTPPPPKKMIKTTTIPPGTVKCTEKPHPGATTKFSYSVTYPSGEKKDETFMSYYKPWGEVCLTGVTQEELDASKAAGEVDDAGVIVVSADAAGAAGTAPTP